MKLLTIISSKCIYILSLYWYCTVPQMIPKVDPERKMGMTWTQVSGSSCRFYYYYNKSG